MRNWFTVSRVCYVILIALIIAGMILAIGMGSVSVVSYECVSIVALLQIILNLLRLGR